MKADIQKLTVGKFECPKCGAQCIINQYAHEEPFINHGESTWDPNCMLKKETRPVEYLLNLG
jgi:C4-type Zn-finger protein